MIPKTDRTVLNTQKRRNPHVRTAPTWLSWRSLLVGGFWCGMFIGTHLPKIPSPIRKVSDKTMHTLSFAGLACLLAWVTYQKQSTFRHCAFVLLVIAVYGAFDELLQIPVGRHCDFQDWLADMAGAVIGLTLFHVGLTGRKSMAKKISVKN